MNFFRVQHLVYSALLAKNSSSGEKQKKATQSILDYSGKLSCGVQSS